MKLLSLLLLPCLALADYVPIDWLAPPVTVFEAAGSTYQNHREPVAVQTKSGRLVVLNHAGNRHSWSIGPALPANQATTPATQWGEHAIVASGEVRPRVRTRAVWRVSERKRPNVLFISVDDMNDWVGCLGHPQVRTPHIDRLAARGLLFTNAHCVVPVCNPSRVATLTGLRPDKTGVQENSHALRRKLPDLVTLPQYFREHGYRALGGGKIFHDVPPHCHDPRSWDDYFWWNKHGPKGGRSGKSWRSPYSIPPDPEPANRPTQEITALTKRNFDWGSVDLPDSAWPDGQVADWASDVLSKPQEAPFFLAVGIFRPHVPWFNPPRFAEQYPLAKIALPPVSPNDLDDLGPWARARAQDRNSKHDQLVKSGAWPAAVQAYLASISHADANLGRVLDALDAGPHRDNTLIVFWSDHGYHLGEKGHWHKRTLWERATRVPLIIAGPGIAPSRCEQPVSLLDLYPTLLELCDLPARPVLDGRSLVPLLRSPQQAWPYPALITYLGNHAVRDQRWRYIRYTDGNEELYDHLADPNEWTNLAARPQHAPVLRRLRKRLPSP